MFNCKDSIDVLLAFLDGEMSPEEEEAAPGSTSTACPPCVDFVRTYRATAGPMPEGAGEVDAAGGRRPS